MRHQHSTTTTTALSALIAALPTDRLVGLVLALLNGATPPAVEAPAKLAPPRRVGWPKGRKRGPRSTTRAKAAADAEAKAARNARQALRTRERRAASREASAAVKAPEAATNAGNGAHGADGANGVPAVVGGATNKVTRAARALAARTLAAKSLWTRAEALEPKAPWKAVAREFDLNDALCVDAHRAGKLPPGVSADAVAKFVEVPAPA